MQLFLDLDGVFVDFDRHYEKHIGPVPDRDDPNQDVSWAEVSKIPFFEEAPPMHDAHELFDYVKRHNPIFLTGVPKIGTEKAAASKRDWVARHLGHGFEVRPCRSRDKSLHCSPGDVIVDDWKKYQPLWLKKGGIWVLHKSAAKSIAELKELGL